MGHGFAARLPPPLLLRFGIFDLRLLDYPHFTLALCFEGLPRIKAVEDLSQ